jgi:hypothetical protein
VSNQEKSPIASSTHSAAEVQEAEDNLTRCLEAFDQKGEAGFQEEWERINPNPALQAVGLRKVQTSLGHVLVSDKSYLKRRPATASEME